MHFYTRCATGKSWSEGEERVRKEGWKAGGWEIENGWDGGEKIGRKRE